VQGRKNTLDVFDRPPGGGRVQLHPGDKLVVRHSADDAVDISRPDPLAQQIADKGVAQHRRRHLLSAVEPGLIGGEQDEPRHLGIGKIVAGGLLQDPAGGLSLRLLPGGSKRP
jgi:hypothetical protein